MKATVESREEHEALEKKLDHSKANWKVEGGWTWAEDGENDETSNESEEREREGEREREREREGSCSGSGSGAVWSMDLHVHRAPSSSDDDTSSEELEKEDEEDEEDEYLNLKEFRKSLRLLSAHIVKKETAIPDPPTDVELKVSFLFLF